MHIYVRTSCQLVCDSVILVHDERVQDRIERSHVSSQALNKKLARIGLVVIGGQ